MNQNKVLQMIGLATKAGKCQSGEFSTEKAIKEGKAQMVFVAENASDNTKKLFKNKCAFYNVEYAVYATKEQLGSATGNELRASIAITDAGFGKSIMKILNENV